MHDNHNPTLALPSEPARLQMFIGGKFVDTNGEAMIRRSPAHGHPVSIVPGGTPADVDHAVRAARQAFDEGPWPKLSGADRAEVLLEAARIIRERRDELAYLDAIEGGKPISQGRGEVEGGASIFEYAAGQARAIHGETFNNLGEKMIGIVTKEPIGVVGLIMPWNFPFYLLAERIPFILAAGCTCVVKPSELTSASTLKLAEILKEAGLPDGVYNVVTGNGENVGGPLVNHDLVDMVSFTGSTPVGRTVVKASAGNMKKLGLELGGKNPAIVFADADLDAAADGVAFGFMYNAGQCCVSGSRLLVERSITEEFAKRVATKVAKLVIGDPLDENTQVGAIVDTKQYQKILGYIEKGKQDGALLVCGGSPVEPVQDGMFVPPTIFVTESGEVTIARDEIFGPVLTVIPFDDFDGAIREANNSVYGLAATIWTKDLNKALEAMRRVKAGRVWINCTIAGGPELPIGGFRQSGIGRVTGLSGVEDFCEVKSTHIELGERARWIAE